MKLEELVHLVLFEADISMELGNEKDIEKIMMFMKKVQAQLQVTMFSATVPSFILQLASNYFQKGFSKVNLTEVEDDFLPNTMKNYEIMCKNEEEKKERLVETILDILYKQPESKILVFVNSGEEIQKLQNLKELQGVAPAFFSNLTQEKREILLHLFSKGAIRCMLTTDVASKGLESVIVDYVIHYDVSKNYKNFIQRSGWCRKSQGQGVNIYLATERDKDSLQNFVQNTKIELAQIEKFEVPFPPVNYEEFQKTNNLDEAFLEAKELIHPIKEYLLQQYSPDELIERFILLLMNLDFEFKKRFFLEEMQISYITIQDDEGFEQINLAEELQIPSHFVFLNRPNKLLVCYQQSLHEEFVKNYIKPGFQISPLDHMMAKSQLIQHLF